MWAEVDYALWERRSVHGKGERSGRVHWSVFVALCSSLWFLVGMLQHVCLVHVCVRVCVCVCVYTCVCDRVVCDRVCVTKERNVPFQFFTKGQDHNPGAWRPL